MFRKLSPLAKNFIRICLPVMLIGLGIVVFGFAAQTWNNPSTGQVIANLDNTGNLNLTGSGSFNFSPGAISVVGTAAQASGGTAGGTFLGATLNGGTLTSGTLSVYEPFAGANYKEVIITATSAYAVSAGTLNITFPVPFTTGGTLSCGTMCNNLTGSATSTFAQSGGTGGVLTMGGTVSGTMIFGGR